ncbi:DUF916 domain-containing protein [Candidatus Saccharibacteria bacterium]|nr:MAG: DUF916 domain-containing protein [Candidatus Saccharibacteria bacterium]
MRYTLRFTAILLALTTVFNIAILAPQAFAQQKDAASGLRVSPVRTDLVMAPGSVRTVNVTVNNITGAETEYQAVINDFVAGKDEFGQPALILDADKFAPSHSLKRYISPLTNVTVPSGKSKTITVTITIPKDAAAGGYYGAVRFLPVSGKQGRNITLAASVGSLMLVKVPGDIIENMKLTSFDVRTSEEADKGSSFFTSNKNLYAVARFTNNGNAHEQPFGKVVLKKGGKIVQTVEINSSEPKGNVLPDSVRRFSVKLDKVGLWGKYTVEGNFGYGANGQLLSGKTSFTVIPLTFIIIGLLLLAGLIGAIIGLPRAIKRYNAKVVRKANRR